MGNREKRLETVLYNAISLLIDETFEQYDDSDEWFAMIQKELGCSKEELMELGIEITSSGGLDKVKGKNTIKPLPTEEDLRQYALCESFNIKFAQPRNTIFVGNEVVFVNKEFTKILLPYVYAVEREENCTKFTFSRKNNINMDKAEYLLSQFREK